MFASKDNYFHLFVKIHYCLHPPIQATSFSLFDFYAATFCADNLFGAYLTGIELFCFTYA